MDRETKIICWCFLIVLVFFCLILYGQPEVQRIEIESSNSNVTDNDLKVLCLNYCHRGYNSLGDITTCLNSCKSYVED